MSKNTKVTKASTKAIIINKTPVYRTDEQLVQYAKNMLYGTDFHVVTKYSDGYDTSGNAITIKYRAVEFTSTVDGLVRHISENFLS